MKLNHIIIHELRKEQHQKIEPSKIRSTELDPENEIVIKLITGVVKLYGKRQNAAQYGVFAINEGRGHFPDPAENYAKNENPSVLEFKNLAKTGMDSLYTYASVNSPASGGYIIFADYTASNDHFFLAAMIKQKSGITLSENLEPEELQHLELDKLTQATRINLTKLSKFIAEEDEEKKKEMNYLSFISSGSNKSTSGYFIASFGCLKGTASAQATKSLIKECSSFFAKKDDLKSKKREFKTALINYLNEKINNKESAKLYEIEDVIRKYIPNKEEGQAEALLTELVEHLNSEKIAVPKEFPVNKTAVKQSTQIRNKNENWELHFYKTALGETESAQIYYDRKNQKISISDLPEAMVNEIEKELAERKEN